jgi:hypothetical protein
MLPGQKTSKHQIPDIATKIGTHPALSASSSPPPGGGLIESLEAHLFSLALLLMPSKDLG